MVASAEETGAADAARAWYYVSPETQETAGPLDASGLAGVRRSGRWGIVSRSSDIQHLSRTRHCAGLLDTSVLTVNSLVWAQGEEYWRPLKEHAALYSLVYYISSTGTSKPLHQPSSTADFSEQGAATASETCQARSNRGDFSATQAHPGRTSEPADADKDLAEFQAAMTALGEPIRPIDKQTVLPPSEDHEFEDDDGTVYQWNIKLGKYQPKAGTTADLPDYDMEAMTFVTDEETIPTLPNESANIDNGSEKSEETEHAGHGNEEDPIQSAGNPNTRESKTRKRGAEDVFNRIADKQKKAKMKEEAQKQWFDLKVNTSIYITGLPEDVSEAQIGERFAAYGVLKAGENGAARIKLYRDKATQIPKGDGLVTFLYQPSVELACNLADGDYFRPNMTKKMTVQPAKFEMHGKEYVPKKKPNKKKNSKDRAKLAEKVLGWGGFDDKLKPTQVTVILKNLFHPEEMADDPNLLKDLESDVREECMRLGPVEKIRIFAGNPLGVVSVKYKTEDAAQACIQKMDGRFFGGRQVNAALWDGFTNYTVKLEESIEQQNARLEGFRKHLQAQEFKEAHQDTDEQGSMKVSQADDSQTYKAL